MAMQRMSVEEYIEYLANEISGILNANDAEVICIRKSGTCFMSPAIPATAPAVAQQFQTPPAPTMEDHSVGLRYMIEWTGIHSAPRAFTVQFEDAKTAIAALEAMLPLAEIASDN